jgi:hypothetical protein
LLINLAHALSDVLEEGFVDGGGLTLGAAGLVVHQGF